MKTVTVRLRRPDEDPILAGRLNGKRMFVRVLEELPGLFEPYVVVLDFVGIDIATSSFLSELLVPLRDHLRLRRPAGYVVAANPSEKVLEEMDEMLSRMGEALLICDTSGDGQVSQVQLSGKLEPKLLDTFNLVRRKGETSAVELHNGSTDSDGVGPTAWNNRLAALAGKSLIVEVSHGRTKKYRSILENK